MSLLSALTNRALLSLLLLILFTGCDLFDSNNSEETEDAVLTTELRTGLESRIDSTIIDAKIPGAAVVVKLANGEIFEYGAGYSNMETGREMQITDRFRIGSITKTFVATVILQLVDEGEVSLDATVATLLPDVNIREADAITVRDLLRHTTGIPNYTGSLDFLLRMFHEPLKQPTTMEILAAAEALPRAFPPGAIAANGNLVWGYSNTNYTLLGLIIERTTGSTIGEQINSRIVTPLGLQETYYATSLFIPDDLVRGYMDIQTSDYAGSGIPGDGNPYYDITHLHPQYAAAAGAMISTAPDLAIFADAFITGEFYSQEIVQQRNEYVTAEFASAVGNYGLGIAKVGDNWIGHKGGLSGYELSMYRKDGVATVIVLTNKSPNGRDSSGELLPEAGPALFNVVAGYLFDEPYTYAKSPPVE